MITSQNATNLIQKLPPPYLIVGLGKSGLAAQRLLLAAGIPKSSIASFDEKSGADFNDPQIALNTIRPRTLVVSPGYHLKKPWLIEAKANGLVITSEISLAQFFLSSEKRIGVTGSVGKSTICALLGYAFEKISESVLVCGNFGYPLADYAADLIQGKTSLRKWLVIELSSYQLENCDGLSLDCGTLASLTPNHLERYLTKPHYYASKLQIFRITTGFKICGTRSPGLFSFFNELAQGMHQQALFDMGFQGIDFLNELVLAEEQGLLPSVGAANLSFGQKFFDLIRSRDIDLPTITDSKLIGPHNIINLLVCMCVFRSFGFAEKADAALLQYPGLPHRLENLGEKKHVLFINDSKATTLESVVTAAETLLQSYPDRSGWLLVGGRDKNLPWEELKNLQSRSQLRFVFFGECGALAQQKCQISGVVFPKLKSALDYLSAELKPGDVVLLSPGGTSLDEFKNFEERGDFFKNWVHNLK